MYDELIAELRMHYCDAKEDDTQEVCEECAYDVIIADKSVPSGIASVCVCGLMHRAADAIEELSRENESLAKSVNEASEILRRRWIPVEELLPEENGDYIVYCIGGNYNQTSCIILAYWGGDHFYVDSFLTVTHWMNLPEPPKGMSDD